MTPNAAILGPGGIWESSSGFMLPPSETGFLFFITHSFLLTFLFLLKVFLRNTACCLEMSSGFFWPVTGFFTCFLTPLCSLDLFLRSVTLH